MNKKTFRNTAITTMAATATVAAVAPAAAADEVQFEDVNQDSPHYNAIMDLVDQDVIRGYDDGTFRPYEGINRGQAASMLTKALNLETPDNMDEVLSNYDDVNSSNHYAEEIAAVTAEGIFTGDENNEFNTWEDISRQQMATALVKAFNLNDYEGEDVELNTDNISEVHVDSVQKLVDLGISSNPNEFNAYDPIQRDQFATMVTKSQDVQAENAAPSVESVSANTSQKVDVEFDKLPEDLSLEDFTITEEGDLYNEVDVESMASTNGNIELELADALSEDTTYELVYSGGEEAQTMDFTYEKAMPTAVNVLTEKVAVDSGDVELKSEVLAGDTDVTADYDVTYTSDSTAVKNGMVNTNELEAGETFLVRATVGSGEDAVESELEVVVAEASMADSYQFFTINGDGKVDSDLEEADADMTVNNADSSVGQYVVPHVEDQFGELVMDDSDMAAEDFQFESLNPETMLVNENDGKIIGIYNEGTADVKITAPGTNFEQTVSVDVQEPAMLDSFELSETSIDTVDTADEQDVTVTAMDQYGETYSNAEVSVTSDSDAVDVSSANTTDENGEATITVQPVEGQSGEATVEVQVGELETQTMTVNVEEVGTAVDYEIMNSGDDLTYDMNDGEDALAFSVYGVDENGNQTTKQPVDGVDFTVEDSEGNQVEDISKHTVTNDDDEVVGFNAKGLDVGEYTLSASKNDFDYGTVSFEVVDTTPHLSEVSFDDTTINIDDVEGKDIYTILNDQGVTKYDQFGDVIENEDGELEQLHKVGDEPNIAYATVANNDVVEYTSDGNLQGVGEGETTVNVHFNTVDENGEWGTQTVAFNVKNTVDTQTELETAIEDAASTDAVDTITLGGDIELDSQLKLDNSVTLEGNGYSLNDKTGNGPNVVSVTADDVTINNLTFTTSTAYVPTGETSHDDWGINVGGGTTGFELNDSEITDYYGGVYLNANAEGTITNTTIKNSAAAIGVATDNKLSDLVGEVKGNTFDTYQYQGIGWEGQTEGNDAVTSLEEDNTFTNGADNSIKVGNKPAEQ